MTWRACFVALVAALLCDSFGAVAQTARSPEALPAPDSRRVADLQVSASGVFINEAGDVLTARHAVADCRSLFVVKDGRVERARVRTLSAHHDLALLATGLKPYLSATLAGAAIESHRSVGVFTESYNVLQRMPERGITLTNALTVAGSEDLMLISSAQPGASGSAVLSGGGLLVGLVVERIATVPGTGTTALSRSPTAGGRGGASNVRALSVSEVKRFLFENDIPFRESDAAQLAPSQSPASRAATLAVGIICG